MAATTEYLLFIDSNAFLHFYRAHTEFHLGLLERLEAGHAKIITSCQVEMEFKKNRQKVILDSREKIRKSDGITIPAFLRKTKAVSTLKKNQKSIVTQVQTLHERTKRVLANPTTSDPVYRCIQRLFRSKVAFNLRENDPIYNRIRARATRRFLSGHPPRKDKDLSIGDAINWEWIVEVARQESKNVVIVSSDQDYGCSINKDSYINDWLLQEFRNRVSKHKKVVLTQLLSEGFAKIGVRVSEKAATEEKNLLINQQLEQICVTDPQTGSGKTNLDIIAKAFYDELFSGRYKTPDVEKKTMAEKSQKGADSNGDEIT